MDGSNKDIMYVLKLVGRIDLNLNETLNASGTLNISLKFPVELAIIPFLLVLNGISPELIDFRCEIYFFKL